MTNDSSRLMVNVLNDRISIWRMNFKEIIVEEFKKSLMKNDKCNLNETLNDDK